VELQPFSATELITGGILLISLEVFLFSFFIIWFGFASTIVGVASIYYQFNSGTEQLGVISVIALLLFFILSKPLKEKLMKPKESLSDDKKEFGTFKNGRILYQGTFWSYSSKDELVEGDEVEITSQEGNRLTVKKRT
jgi:membrane protein implicated in regulation of membrane protease activity